MADNRHLSSISEQTLPAILETLDELGLSAEYSAASRLAVLYAKTIDEADAQSKPSVLEKIGPKLLAVLVELKATPRSQETAGQDGPQQTSKLAKFRLAGA